jgi:hypothetical protein
MGHSKSLFVSDCYGFSAPRNNPRKTAYAIRAQLSNPLIENGFALG